MSAKFGFSFQSHEARRPLPPKLIIAQNETETIAHVGLKLLAFLLFARDRLQLETRLPDDSVPFIPDLVQLDYTLRPVLWVECGECSIAKLHKLAVKAPDAEIWVVKKSISEAEHLLHAMEHEELRRNRYGVIAFEPDVLEDVCNQLHPRNDLQWFGGGFQPPAMQFDLNGLWFEIEFALWRH